MVLPKMSGYLRVFKVKDGDKDNNNLMSYRWWEAIKNIKPLWLRLKT